MLLLYTPAFLAGAVSFWIFPNEGLRSTILQSALTLHYFKRVFEVIPDILINDFFQLKIYIVFVINFDLYF